MKNETGSFKTYEDPEHGWMWNGDLIKVLDRSEIQIKNKKYNIAPGIRNAFVNASYNAVKSISDMDKLALEVCYILQNTMFVSLQKVKHQVVINR